jgi:hypothetical protein
MLKAGETAWYDPILMDTTIEASWNVMAHTQKPDFVLQQNGRVHLNQHGRQSSRLLAAEVCASAVVMQDTSCSEVVWRVLATHSIRQFPLHFPSCASLCAITFQLESTNKHFTKYRKWEGAEKEDIIWWIPQLRWHYCSSLRFYKGLFDTTESWGQHCVHSVDKVKLMFSIVTAPLS